MDRLANILKQRLAAQQSSGSEHPSPDTLVAFVEHGLQAEQQERVLSHLGLCPACRQAIALAALEPTELQPSVSRTPARARIRFSAIGWASTAAAVAVAMGIGALLYQHRDEQTVPSRTEVAKTQVAEAPASAVSGAPQSLNTPARRARPRIASNASAGAIAQFNDMGRSQHLENKKAKPSEVMGGLVASSRVDSEPTPATDSMTFNRSSSPPPLPEKAFEIKPELPANAVSSLQVQSKVENPAPQSYAQSRGTMESAELRRNEDFSKSGVSAETAPESQPSTGATMKAVATPAIGGSMKPHAAYASSLARWTISSNGKLQRVSQNGDSAAVEPAPGVTVRTVAAQGIEVWAGGSEPDLSATKWQQRPVLFHSSDAGETWTRIDGPWQGAIQSLALPDLHSLTVVTSDGRWTTSDAGKSWARK